ncbi:MAG: PEP-CTERM sorting domain-containing protein [Dissulfurispiraceae bacterium]|nr:PEP-CTERM sorting domain-containing protein [Dissulfurispiraceae bacterium]
MRGTVRIFIAVLLVAIMASPVFAKDITIFDGWYEPNAKGKWKNWVNKKDENNEVEPGNTGGQEWDLESFDLTDTTLRVTGGFNFFGIVDDVRAGHIFIDIDNSANYGNNTGNMSYVGSAPRKDKTVDIYNTFGWDFVIVPDFLGKTMQYSVYMIDETSILKSPHFRDNENAGPWQYVSNGELILSGQELVKIKKWKDGEGWHYAYEVDLGFLLDYGLDYEQLFLVHTTMECGNDMMMGQSKFDAPPVSTPEPSTIILLGAGLAGLGLYTRKRFKA